ncbi:MAG: carboxylesterase family protein [Pseudomonadota bacterium]
MFFASVLKGKSARIAIGATACLAFAACSDVNDPGPGQGGGTGTTPNNPPVFTSANTVSVAENSAGSFYTATANDPNGDDILFSVTGGADQAQFNIVPGPGSLLFVAAPDFEAPADADGDNVYEVEITATDERGATAVLQLTVTVTDLPDAAGIRFRDRIFTDVAVQRGFVFASDAPVPGGTVALELDVFQPGTDTERDRPVMIIASGGGFLVQDRTTVEDIAIDFAQRGWVAVTMDYRTLSGAPITPDDLAIGGLTALHDMFAAVRFVRADAQGADTLGTREDAIFVAGESAGGVMAALAATFDPSDPVPTPAIGAFLTANGGVFGTIGDNDAVDSTIQGAMPLSGAILDLTSIDINSAPLYAAHDEFDPVVPCDTGPEGSSFTGLVVSGSCDIVPAYVALGLPAELFLVAGSAGHVSFTDAQRDVIYQEAAELFFDEVISTLP